jgi:hypothetical protein
MPDALASTTTEPFRMTSRRTSLPGSLTFWTAGSIAPGPGPQNPGPRRRQMRGSGQTSTRPRLFRVGWDFALAQAVLGTATLIFEIRLSHSNAARAKTRGDARSDAAWLWAFRRAGSRARPPVEPRRTPNGRMVSIARSGAASWARSFDGVLRSHKKCNARFLSKACARAGWCRR